MGCLERADAKNSKDLHGTSNADRLEVFKTRHDYIVTLAN